MKHFQKYFSAAAIGCSVLGMAAMGQKAVADDFIVRVENVSTPHTLHTSKGDKSVGLSPGVWVLHTGDNPIYAPIQRASLGLKHLAEDGNPEGLYSDLQLNPRVKATGAYNYAALPYPVAGFIGPKQAFEFVVPNASPGDRLSLANMFIESNDWFFSNNSKGIALFNADGTPMNGEVTSQMGLWDAGTEEDEEPGVGPNQAPRQSRPDTGKSENVPVAAAPLSAPAVGSLIRITIMPKP